MGKKKKTKAQKQKKQKKQKAIKLQKRSFDYYVGGNLKCCPICGQLMENMVLKYNQKETLPFRMCGICQKYFYTFHDFEKISNKATSMQRYLNDKVCIFDNHILRLVCSCKSKSKEIVPDYMYKTGDRYLIFDLTFIKVDITSKNYCFNVFCSEKNYATALKIIKKRANRDAASSSETPPKSKQNTMGALCKKLHSYSTLRPAGANPSASSKIRINENAVIKKSDERTVSKPKKDEPKLEENFNKQILLKTDETNKADEEKESLTTNNISTVPPINEPAPVKTLDTKNKTVHLYIFKGYLTLSRDRLRDYNLLVYDIIHNYSYEIFVTYDFISGKLYMSYEQYLYYRKCKLNVRFSMSNTGTQLADIYDSFADASELALYGYSVGYTSYLTEDDRHKILTYLIDNNIMKPYSIISHLQGQIRLKEKITYKDYSLAISEWESDIRFVDRYSKKSKKIETKNAIAKEDYFIIEE